MCFLRLPASGTDVALGAPQKEVSPDFFRVVKLTVWEITASETLLADLALKFASKRAAISAHRRYSDECMNILRPLASGAHVALGAAQEDVLFGVSLVVKISSCRCGIEAGSNHGTPKTLRRMHEYPSAGCKRCTCGTWSSAGRGFVRGLPCGEADFPGIRCV